MPEMPAFTSSFTSIERPYFSPKQVRTLKGIKPDEILIGNPIHFVYKIVEKPKQDEKGNWYAQVLLQGIAKNDKWYSIKLYLSDYGIVPYLDGTWNSKNWLSRI